MRRGFAIHLLTIGIAVASAACGSNTSAAGPGGGGGGGRRGGRGGDSGPAPVVTTKVTEKDVPIDLAAIGNVEAYATISIRSQVVAQESAVEGARVNLSYTVIRSPIDGRTGAVAVKVGGLATANNTELMTIARVEPIYVTFAVPAVHLSTIKNHMKSGTLPV